MLEFQANEIEPHHERGMGDARALGDALLA